MSLSEQLQMLSSPQGIRMLMYSVHRKTKPVSNLAKVLVGVALPKVKKYGLPVAAIYLLLSHFGIKRKQNWTMIKSLSFALKSSTLWKMVLSSLAFTVAMKRLFGFASSKAFPAFFVTVWTMMYRYRVVEAPTVWFRRTYWNSHIVEKARIAQEYYWPVFWAFNRHAQTITCFILSALEGVWAPKVNFTRETIPCFDEPNVQFIDWGYIGDETRNAHKNSTTDGGAHSDDAASSTSTSSDSTSLPSQAADVPERVTELPRSQVGQGSSGAHWDTPVILCIHGLGDEKNTPYIQRFARMAISHGWRVAVWSYWRFDFEESRDLHLVVKHIQKHAPHAPIVAVAWSAGTYSLTRYLEKIGKDTPLVAAVCQSGCLDFAQAVTDVCENEHITYPQFLLGQEKICIRRHVENDKLIMDKAPFDALLRSERHPMNLYNRFLCLLPKNHTPDNLKLGHCGELGRVGPWHERVKTASHYTTTAIDDINKIAVTTLLLHAEDDPVVSSEHIDWQRVESNRNIIVAHTKRGGHCAWHEGLFPFGDTWGDRVTTRFISTVLESHSQTHFIVELVNQAMNAGVMEQEEDEAQAMMANVRRSEDLMSTRSVPSSPFQTPSWGGVGSPAALNSAHVGHSNGSVGFSESRDRFDSNDSNGWDGEPQVQYRPMFQPQPQSLSKRRGLNLSHQLMARITSAADLASMGRPTLAYARGEKVRTSVTDLESLAAEGGGGGGQDRDQQQEF